FWALAAEATLRREASHVGAAAPPVAGVALSDMWAEADPALFVSAAGSEAGAHQIEVSLRVGDFADFADLSTEEQARQSRELITFVKSLIGVLEAPRVRLDRVWTRHVLRVGGGFALLVTLLAGGLYLRSQRENARDWALGRPYK